MNKFKKIVFIVSFVAICGLFFNFSAPTANAITADEIRAQIAILVAQISELQKQLTESGGWCHTFNQNLKIGDSSDDVQELETALAKEGFSVTEHSSNFPAVFDEKMASSVVGFQQKYKQDILAPWGLEYGTGFVGKTTREKLNELYGCGIMPDITCANLWWYDNNTQYCQQKQFCGTFMYLGLRTFATKQGCETALQPTASITVLSPNGGEQWVQGETYEIKWNQTGLEKVHISLVGYDGTGRQQSSTFLYTGYISDNGKLSYGIPLNMSTSERYKIQIASEYVIPTGMGGIIDESDNYFSIVVAQPVTCHTSDLWAWDYCSPSCKCNVGEGDCDTDADCADGLYCAKNVGVNYSQISTMDVCEVKQEQPASITVTSPNGGEQYNTGDIIHIKWITTSKSKMIMLDIRDEEGISCGKLAQFSVPNTGSYAFNTTYNLSPNKYKIVAFICPDEIGEYCYRDIEGLRIYGYDESDNYFSTVGEPTTSINVISPNGGEQWVIAGGRYLIRWEQKGLDGEKVLIELGDYGEDGTPIQGSRYIATDFPANIESYTWTVPLDFVDYYNFFPENTDIYNFKYKIVVMTYGGDVMDQSDNYFSIVAPTSTTCHTSDLWAWDYCSPSCKCDAGEGDCDTDADCADGLYCAQNVGVNYSQVSTMDVCEVKQEQPASITVTSPNGGEQWVAGNTYEITWNSQGIDKVNVEIMGASLRKTIATLNNNPGFYNYTIPDTFLLGKYSIRVHSYDLHTGDDSDSNFSIVPPTPTTCHTSDLWAWNYCSPSCKCDAGEGDCDTDADCADGLYCAQNVGVNYSQVSTMDVCEVKQAQEKSITVISPNGDEQWVVGGTYQIRAVCSFPSSIDLWLITYSSGRKIDIMEIASNLSCGPGGHMGPEVTLYNWIIPSSLQPKDLLKSVKIVAHTMDGKFRDESDNYFSIVAAGSGTGLDLGASCSAASECVSGFCVDGVCCNNLCAGRDCQTCGALSSQGIGYCGYVNSSSEDPRNTCSNGSAIADGCESDNCSGKNWSCGVVQNHNDGGCPACQTCDGINTACKAYDNNTQDVNGVAFCKSCKQCMGGSCENIPSFTDPFSECEAIECGNGSCNGAGKCDWLTQGEGKCPACKTCNGATSLACKYFGVGEKDNQGNNVCYEAYPGAHYRCDGRANCTAPTDLIQTGCFNWGSNSCEGYCPTWCNSESMCKECWGSAMRVYSDNFCSGTGGAVYSGSCNQLGGSCKCFYERYLYE